MEALLVYSSRSHARNRLLGALGIGALFLLLIVAAFFMIRDTGAWLPALGGTALLVLALFGLWTSFKERARDQQRPGTLVLIADEYGIGDQRQRVPWQDVAAVEVSLCDDSSPRPVLSISPTKRLAHRLSDSLTQNVGIFDGSFAVLVVASSGKRLVFEIGPNVPATQWPGIRDAIFAHAQAHRVTCRSI